MSHVAKATIIQNIKKFRPSSDLFKMLVIMALLTMAMCAFTLVATEGFVKTRAGLKCRLALAWCTTRCKRVSTLLPKSFWSALKSCIFAIRLRIEIPCGL
jgi:hypothetical protein